ncbi:MAG: amidotransferase [Bryobacterales bacterium]|nr:amidotransferase [Bryobacterales bacterium]
MVPHAGAPLRIHCLMHVPFEGPGAIAEWARDRGHAFTAVRLFQGEPQPRPDQFDLLVVMGGPMSVHDEAEFPWLPGEKALIASALRQETFVLGVCLGSQLIAEALGATVRKNACKEIGWFPIRAGGGADTLFGGLPEEMTVLHWHGETYDLPEGARLLASSEGCAVQAFEHRCALGLQFHFEIQRAGLEALLENCAHEIGAGPYEQEPRTILSGEFTHGGEARRILFELLDRIERRLVSS